MLPKRLMPDECVEFMRAVVQKYGDKSHETTAVSDEESMPSGNGIVISGLSFTDHLTYQFYNAYAFRKNFIVLSSITLVFTMFMTMFALMDGDFIYPALCIAILVLSNSFLAVVAFIMSNKDKKNPTPVMYRFQEDGFHMDHKFGKLFIRWDKLYAARDTGNYYFLYLTKTHAVILPKSLLNQDAKASIQCAIMKYGLKEKKNRS